ncbi:hypothetical protein C8F01DRAFT_3823 [Mycena amicta]|nr:hypothetical protein C8F01DRAFT_3823 [Mycena amicta]
MHPDSNSAARAADRTRLSDVEEEIQRFETHLAALHTEKEQIRRRLDEYAYPVLTLPNEITTEIFVHYLPPYPDYPPFVGMGSPAHLLGICRLWRSIALHSPALWRSMKLDETLSEHRVDIVQTWLKRSGSSPLSLHLNFSLDTVSVGRSELLQAVVAHRSRWEYVDLRASAIQVSFISGPCPRLVRMTVTTWGLTGSVPLILVQNAHLLRSVSLWNIAYNTTSLPWAQLTSLSLRNTTLVESGPILRMAVNLLRCKLLVHGTGEGIQIQLPRLEVFSLINWSDEHECIDAFTLPSLRKLEVGQSVLGVHAVERLQSLISRSECRLERLRIVSRPSERAGDPVVDAYRIAFPLADVDALDYRRFSNNWQVEEYWDLNTDSPEDGDDSEEEESEEEDSD